jgi:hypothetical protein
MTVSKALNPRSSEGLNMTRDALSMFSILFSNAIFTKQGKRIRCCAAAWRSRHLKSLGNG